MKNRARTLVEQSVHALATGKEKEYVTMSKRISNGQSSLLSMHRRTFIKGECA
jgi:hypothetical protein